jgi:hypothetical protein
MKELVSDVSRAVDALIKEFNLGMIFVLLQVIKRMVLKLQMTKPNLVEKTRSPIYCMVENLSCKLKVFLKERHNVFTLTAQY